MAMMLYIALLWVALGHFRPNIASKSASQQRRGMIATTLLFMVYSTILSGGLVAGLNAGSGFNTFPLMNGQLIPQGLFVQTPWYANMTENLMTVQFNHRYLALFTAGCILVFGGWNLQIGVNNQQKKAILAMFGAVLLQISLGIATLLSVVWLPLASGHQMGAVVLLSALIWVNHELWRPIEKVTSDVA